MRLPSLVAIILTLALSACGTDAVVAPPPPPPPAQPPSPESQVDRIDLSTIQLLLPGSAAQLTATPRDASGSPVYVPVEWSTSDPAVASVSRLSNGRGNVIAISAGTATITASIGTVRGSTVVTVANPNATSVTLPITELVLTVGNQYALQATVLNGVGQALPVGFLNWSSSAPAIVAVSSTGRLTALALGEAVITVEQGALRATVRVSARAAAMVIKPSYVEVAAGDTARLSAVLTGANGQTLPYTVSVVWSSDHPELVTVDANGWVRGMALPAESPPRTAIITATSSEFTAQRAVLLSNVPAGVAVGVRYVHAASGLGAVTMVPSKGAPALLSFGSIVDQSTTSGLLHVDVLGFPSPPTYEWGQSFTGVLAPEPHLTLYAIGGNLQGYLIPLWDDHPPVGSEQVMIRIFMASEYARSYLGNNIYLLPAGAPIDDSPLATYFELASATDYLARPVGEYDLVLVDPPSGTPTPGNLGTEYARFRVRPESGRAITFAITGNGPGSMGLITVLDP